MEAKLRRYKDTVAISGVGVMLFGIWSFLKLGIYVKLDNAYLESILGEQFLDDRYMKIFWIFMCIFAVLDILMRYYVLRKSRAEKESGAGGRLYIVFAVGIMLSSVLSIFTQQYKMDKYLADKLADALIELTSISTTAELIWSAIQIKRLNRPGGNENAVGGEH